MPWELQATILQSVRDNPRTAVKSCHASGKSWIAARVALWFFSNFPGSIVATTAPTFRQVEKIIWPEIRSAYKRSRWRLPGRLLSTQIANDDKWFAFGFATDDPDKFQGLHADHILVIVDETSGLNDAIFEAIEGVLSGGHARLLEIGNPTDPLGAFAREFKTLPSGAKFTISAFDTPNFSLPGITLADIKSGAWEAKLAAWQDKNGGRPLPFKGLVNPAWVADKHKRWGEDSSMWKARVMGQFPDTAPDQLIPLSWIEAAQMRAIQPGEPRELGVDVARYGNDETVFCLRKGDHARIIESYQGRDLMHTAHRTEVSIRDDRVSRAKIDDSGLGGGVTDYLVKEAKAPAVGMNAGTRARRPDKFINARAEWYWDLRERFRENRIDIDELDDDLAGQLAGIRYKLVAGGKIAIESKEDMKERGLGSPDRADALMLSFAEPFVVEEIIAMPISIAMPGRG